MNNLYFFFLFFKCFFFFFNRERMGDAAKIQRREQLKRWSGSSTDREPAAPRRRWRDEPEDGEKAQDADGPRAPRQNVKRR